EMDGIVAVQKLKKKGNNCPVIALTASIDDAEKTRVIDAGMDDFITKPTRLEDLSRMLTKWCLK
ncbi:MAG: response regulator, partial [Marinilabiliaceae bacterium]|nr:response regulator [Marinilabiliaceae bacterium]